MHDRVVSLSERPGEAPATVRSESPECDLAESHQFLLRWHHRWSCWAYSPRPASAYNPITPTDAGQKYVLNGHNLTLDKLVAIARYGAKVDLSKRGPPALAQRVLLAARGLPRGNPDLLLQPRDGRRAPERAVLRRPAVHRRHLDVANLSPDGPAVLEPGLHPPAPAGDVPERRSRRRGPGDQRRGDRPRDDGRARQHDVLRGGHAAGHPDADRPAQQGRHPGRGVAWLPG